MGLVSDIIKDGSAGGNPSPMTLSIPYTTVQGWEVADFVPEWRRPVLIGLAIQRLAKAFRRLTTFRPSGRLQHDPRATRPPSALLSLSQATVGR
jgi:hypothetical protein